MKASVNTCLCICIFKLGLMQHNHGNLHLRRNIVVVSRLYIIVVSLIVMRFVLWLVFLWLLLLLVCYYCILLYIAVIVYYRYY